MDMLNSEGDSIHSSSSSEGEDYVFFLYTKPEMTVPSFLNSDYKWHRSVVKSRHNFKIHSTDISHKRVKFRRR